MRKTSRSPRTLLVGLAAAMVATTGLVLQPAAVQTAAADPVTSETSKPADGLAEGLELVDLANRGEGWLRYRIPALTTAPNGDVLAFYDGRPSMADLPSNITMLMRRSTDGGVSWQDQQVVRRSPAPNGYGDASVLVDREEDRIFLFYAASINQGFGGSSTGSDPDDPNVLHADYSVSEDNGLTWTHHRITDQIKAGKTNWAGMFASSGEGIQLRQGEHAGRLIQQYTVRISGGNYAVSVYSDDHGETWHASEPVGPGADENKTVELANGDVMLNSRAAPYRRVAISSDGGETYTPFQQDTELPDPANNGSISRAFPDADPSDPKAQILLFSNSNNKNVRRNLTIRMSCDSGESWTVAREVQSGASAYSTLTPLPGADGTLGEGGWGLFYEREGYRHLSYTHISADWLDGVCAGVQADNVTTTVAPGATTTVPVTVENQSGAELAAGTLDVDSPFWSATPTAVPALPAGTSQVIDLPVTAAATAAQMTHEVKVTYTNETGTSFGTVEIPVGAGATPAPAFEIRPVLDAIYSDDRTGLIGDRIQPWVEIVNTGNTTLTDFAWGAPEGMTCNVGTLQPTQTAVCRNPGSGHPGHVVTYEDLAAGSWTRTYTATATAGSQTVAAEATLFPVDLDETPGSGETFVWVPTREFDTSSLERAVRVGSVGSPVDDGPLELLVPANSRQSAQLVVTAGPALTDLTTTISALSGPGGELTDAVEARYAQYIPDENYGGLVADPLLDVASIDVPEGNNQPVWFTVRVPEGTAPGTYTGTITFSSAAGEISSHQLAVEVPDLTFRDVAERPFILDLWQHPDAVADALDLEPWSEEHFTALEPYWADLAEAGQDVINLAITEDPWLVNHNGEIRPQTYSHYHSTVEWTWDGAEFTFDFSVFDRLVTDALAAGVGPSIHAFAPLQFQGHDRFYYIDAATGEGVWETYTVGDARYVEAWSAFMTAFDAHLKDKGWYSDTRLAFDEQPLSRMNAFFDVLDDISPEWNDKIALAANSLAEADIAEYISFNVNFLANVSQQLIDTRRAEGKPTLYYVWNEPTSPNTVVKTPLQNVRVVPWVVEKRDLDGFLRWTYQSWPEDVYTDPTFRYGQGDEYIVYPGADGPVTSIRWELFKDGQEDAELLDLAKSELGEGNPAVAGALDGVNGANSWGGTVRSMIDHRAEVIDVLVNAELIAGPVDVDANSIMDIESETITATTEIRNRSDADHQVTLSATGDGIFSAEPVTVTIPAGQTQAVSLELSASGVGLEEVTVSIRSGENSLGSSTVTLVAGGAFLSDLEFTEETNGWGPVERDTTNGEDQPGDGGPITLSGNTYDKGIGTHALANVEIPLPGECTVLEFDYGIDDAMGNGGSVRPSVLADGVAIWEPGVITGTSGTASAVVEIPDGTQALTLHVDPNGGNGQDHFDWANIWVRCAVGAAPEPQPTVTVTAPTPTVTVTTTAEETDWVTATPTVTETPTVTVSPTVTVTATATATSSSTQTVEVTVTPSSAPTTEPSRPDDGSWVYTTPGQHFVNGRQWFTECEAYSRTVRCLTDIWATQTVVEDGRFVSTTGWHFNNLTYLPLMTRAQWGDNPLANTGEWTAADGREWRTECDTAVTGSNGCRSYVDASVVVATETSGAWTYAVETLEVLNNIVQFKS